MKTTKAITQRKKPSINVGTWLPLFSGFYNTIWDSQDEIDREIEYINEIREGKGWYPAKFDHFEFDYSGYELMTVKKITHFIEREMKNFVSAITMENVQSPKEYNFANDSGNIIVSLTKENRQTILKYLNGHSEKFAEYLKEKYTSYSGFISHYPNNISGFMEGKPLEHKHKLGSILDFICMDCGLTEMDCYDHVEKYLEVNNYTQLTETEILEGMENWFTEILDLEKCKELCAKAEKDKSIAILCSHYSINIQSEYKKYPEKMDDDYTDFEEKLGHPMCVNDYDDLIVDFTPTED